MNFDSLNAWISLIKFSRIRRTTVADKMANFLGTVRKLMAKRAKKVIMARMNSIIAILYE